MKPRCILFSLAAILVAFSCGKAQEEKPVVQPEIKIPAESQAIFSSGISFPETTGTSPQESTVKFTATESWTTDVNETKASSWLSVRPSSGGAGSVNMTVSAQPNPGETARSAKVTIKCGTVSKTFSVTQAGNPPAVIAVESISLDKTELALVEGEEATLTATVKPDNATEKTVSWRTSDASIATVDNGKVKAIKEGTATISAKAGEKTATCKVITSKKEVPVEAVTLNKSELALTKGQSESLRATVTPDNATNPSVTWFTSNESVASVTQVGQVTAIKTGKVTITAKAGDKSATCEVTITTPVESVSLDRNSVTLEEGQSTTLIATISPNDADEKTVVWSSSSESIATVTNGVVTAVAEGNATITATVGGKSATCAVSVKKAVVAVNSVTLNKTTLALTKGQSETLVATVNPDDATDKTVTWSSGDATIASVDQNGKVTALKSGTVVITAKAGEQSGTCTVSITTPVETVSLDRTSVSLEEEQSTTLVATVSPNDADEKTISWTSSDPSVATVDNNGKVTAVKEGETVIIAAAGGKSATCKVTVQKKVIPVTSVTLNKATLSLTKGSSETLIATVTPDDATDKTVTWSSGDATIASVDQNGKVQAIKAGKVIITASAAGRNASCEVTVDDVPPGGNEGVGYEEW